VSGRLVLRRGVVVAEQPLTVEVEGERRPAWADTALLGEMREGDEVVVNVAALDLGLGSGGFDVVHVNLTRGLGERSTEGQHVMKLNYSSLQHAVEPVEPPLRLMYPRGTKGTAEAEDSSMRVVVLPLHGHLAPAAWAVSQALPGAEVGYLQGGGGALPGSLSRDVSTLRERGLLHGHITAAPAYGGDYEALSLTGALDAAAASLGWDVAVVGPGPGIIGSETRLGHGGMASLDAVHAALALGLPTLLSPRLSSADPRERHRPVSHHTLTVLELLLGPVEIAVPSAMPARNGAPLLDAAVLTEAATLLGGTAEGNVPGRARQRRLRHTLRDAPADLDGYAAADLPARTMGRTLDEDPLFFAAPLAAGAALRGKG
jgi:Protein of unknown function (DUF3866)